MDAPALDLPFDAEAMLPGLRPWVECESPTFDAAAVNRMMDIAARDLALIGARIETHPRPDGLRRLRARHLSASHPERARHPGDGPSGYRAPDRHAGAAALAARGQPRLRPGHLDMKGGNYIAIEAIRQLARAGIATSRPVRCC